MTLADILEANARHNGDGIGYAFGARSLTHRAYLVRARALADALYRGGARRQDRVAVLSMNNIEFMEIYGACEVSALIIATLNFRLTAEDTVSQVSHIGPSVLIFEEQYADMIAEIRERLISVRRFIAIGEAPDWAESYEAVVASGDPAGLDVRPTMDDVAHLMCTSGTTGKPKACILTHGALVRKAQLHAGDMDSTPVDKLLIVMPLFHVGARGVVGAAQWRAGATFVQRSFRAETWLRAVAEERITMGHLAPPLAKEVLDHPLAEELDLSSLRVLLYSAAPMPEPTLRKGLKLLGSVFHQSYGQTEGMVSSLLRCQHKPEGTEAERRRLLSVGQPYPGVSLRIVDSAGRDVPAGEAGEIVYRSPFMFSGYWSDSNTTADALRDGWVFSGDIGRVDEDGFLYIVDRKRDMIITGGENVYSREVETALLAHPDIEEAAVIGVPDEKWGDAVHALVVLREGSALSEEAVIQHCKTLIASYKKPRGVTFLRALPKLANGKINKMELRAMHPSSREAKP